MRPRVSDNTVIMVPSPRCLSPSLCLLTHQRGEVTAQSDWTVARLKEELEKKFPGKIPASLQRLFKGTQLLPSGMTLEEASEVSRSGSTLFEFDAYLFFRPCALRPSNCWTDGHRSWVSGDAGLWFLSSSGV